MKRLLLFVALLTATLAASPIKHKSLVRAQTATQTVQTQDVSLRGGVNFTQGKADEQRFYGERADSQGVIPPGVRHRAMEQLRQIRTPADDRLQWTFIGPMPTVYELGMPYGRDFALIRNG